MKIHLPGLVLEGTPKELFNYYMLTQGYERLINTLQKLSEVEFPITDTSEENKKKPKPKPKDE